MSQRDTSAMTTMVAMAAALLGGEGAEGGPVLLVDSHEGIEHGDQYPQPVTTKSQAPRRAALVVGCATILLLAYAGPASADIPVGWSHPPPVNALRAIMIFVGIPLLITLVILAFLYIPPVAPG